MTKPELLRFLEDTLSLDPNSLTGPESLRDTEGWDSISALTVIAAVDKKFGVALPGIPLSRLQTVNELVALISENLRKKAA